VVTGGGDAPGLNTVIRAVVVAAARRGWETRGILGGFEGLLAPVADRPLDVREMDAILFRGGTVLGTSNRGRFGKRTASGRRQIDPVAVAEAASHARAMDLLALICIGGDGSLRIASALADAGVPVVGVPKTIDNDLAGTDATFGFESAVGVAVDALDRLSSSAESHQRVMVLEVMGHHAGWIAAHAGLAGGADIILIPEIRFTWDAVCRRVEERVANGLLHTVMVVAEGARPVGGRYVMTAASRRGEDRERRLGGIGPRVAEVVERETGRETRSVVLGHLQRGGPPDAWDRQLCTRFGVAAVEAVAAGQLDTMIALRGSSIVPVPLAAGVGRIRTVPVDGELVRAARALGISFGDEPALPSAHG
jgi:6-phosphofructokinase 1